MSIFKPLSDKVQGSSVPLPVHGKNRRRPPPACTHPRTLPHPTYPFLSCSGLLLANNGALKFCVRKKVSVS